MFTYLVLIFSLAVVFYFMGYQSPLLEVLANQGCTQSELEAAEAAGVSINCAMDVQSFVAKLASNITTDTSLQGLIGVAIIGFAVSLLTGFATMYIIPLIMLMVFLNYVVFPISFIADPLLPDMVKIPLFVFFNLLGIMAIVSFVRGST
jgi:hypothetical protein